MFSNLLLITLACTGILMTNASLPAGRYLCERYPHLAICALHAEVDQAIQEMSYLVHVTEQQQPPVLIAQPNEEMITGKDKRKSAFVRFGKRSDVPAVSDDPSAEQQPVDVMINSRPTRKSTYVRFG